MFYLANHILHFSTSVFFCYAVALQFNFFFSTADKYIYNGLDYEKNDT
jgi:hypothetical protein